MADNLVTLSECAVPGCPSRTSSKGLCSKHYQRLPSVLARKRRWYAAAEAADDSVRQLKVARTRAWRDKQRGSDAWRARVAAAQARVSAERRADPAAHRAESRRDWLRRQVGRDPAAMPLLSVVRHDPCAYCGGQADTLDHIVPVASGGTSAWDNLTAACRSCNSRKRSTPLLHALLRLN